MFDRMRRIAAIASACLTVVFVSPANAQGAADAVSLNFAWPEGLQANVEFESWSRRSTDGRNEDVGVTGQYAFTTSRAGQDLLIEFGDVQTQVDSPSTDIRAMMTNFIAKAVSVPPSYVVANDGSFRRLEGLDRFRRNMLDGLDDAFTEFPPQIRDQVVRVLDSVLTDEQLQASIASEWNQAVGAWLGADLDRGDLYELSYEETVPAFNNVTVPMRSTFKFVERVPCNGDSPERRCVKLEMRSFVDPEGLAAAIESFLSQLPAGQDRPQIEAMRQESVVRLVTEPDTLIPHLMESAKHTEMTMLLDGRIQESERLERNRYVYTY